VAEQVPTDDFQLLERENLSHHKNYTKRQRAAQATAERDAQRLRQQWKIAKRNCPPASGTVRLKKEREEIRGRVEKMLEQIESIAEAS